MVKDVPTAKVYLLTPSQAAMFASTKGSDVECVAGMAMFDGMV